MRDKTYIDVIHIYIDGCSKGNPGPAAIGIVITDKEGGVIEKYSEYIGEATNNTAEYIALEKALDIAIGLTTKTVLIFSDSQLVINQMKRNFRIKSPHLLDIHKRIRNSERMFEKVEYTHVSRESEFIKKADQLSNEAIKRLKISTKGK